jgi:hypothetical protein
VPERPEQGRGLRKKPTMQGLGNEIASASVHLGNEFNEGLIERG